MPVLWRARLAAARDRLARLHEIGFVRAGATNVRLISGPPDGLRFGTRLANALRDVPDGGLVILGSGAIPLASLADRRSFVACAGGQGPMALSNNRFSSDILAVADVELAAAACPAISRPTTPCPAGWSNAPACRWPTCAAANAWASTSIRRST